LVNPRIPLRPFYDLEQPGYSPHIDVKGLRGNLPTGGNKYLTRQIVNLIGPSLLEGHGERFGVAQVSVNDLDAGQDRL
jgi:hypothetical protein